jgi:hypothetical protein
MAYTTPTTAVAGVIQTAAIWNASVRDNILYLADRVDNPPRAVVYHNTTQSLANGVDTSVAFNSELTDSAILHDTVTNNNRITIPSGQGGMWLFTGYVEFAANVTGQRKLNIQTLSGTILASQTLDAAAGANPTRLNVAAIVTLAAADWCQLIASQNSGGALNLSATPLFGAQRIA